MTTRLGFPKRYMMLLLKGKIFFFLCCGYSKTAQVADSFCRRVRTRDMGGNSTTHEFTNAVLRKMEQI